MAKSSQSSGAGPIQPEVVLSVFWFLVSVILFFLFRFFTGTQGAFFYLLVGVLMLIPNFIIGARIYSSLARRYKVEKYAGQKKKIWPKEWGSKRRFWRIFPQTFLVSWILVWLIGVSPAYWFFVGRGENETKLRIETLITEDPCLGIEPVEEALSSGPSKGFKKWLVDTGYKTILECADAEENFEEEQALYSMALEWAEKYNLDTSAAERGFREPTQIPPTPVPTFTAGPTQTPITVIETKEVEVVIQPTPTPGPRSFPGLTTEIARVDVSQAPAIVIYMRISPETNDLLPTDFNVYVDGQFVPVQAAISARSEQVPRYFSLIFDVSESMLEGGKLDLAKQASLEFLRSLNAQDQVQIVSFSNNTSISTWGNPMEAEQVITSLYASGSTALYDAVNQASVQLSFVPGRHFMLILSDGEDTASVTSFEQAQLGIAASNSSVFAINLGGNFALLESLVSSSKDYRLVNANAGDLGSVFHDISQVVQSEWRLVVTTNIIDPQNVVVLVASESYQSEWRK